MFSLTYIFTLLGGLIGTLFPNDAAAKAVGNLLTQIGSVLSTGSGTVPALTIDIGNEAATIGPIPITLKKKNLPSTVTLPVGTTNPAPGAPANPAPLV